MTPLSRACVVSYWLCLMRASEAVYGPGLFPVQHDRNQVLVLFIVGPYM